ncbi:MAG: OmpA family protein [Gammaproteobacteria bacterium]|nr:OmpA family protein [Gammaproteobacteria bacterium]
MYRLLITFLLFSLIGTFANEAAAQEFTERWYVSGLASYVDDDKDRSADDGLTGGQFAMGIPFRGAWSLEFFGLYNEFNADGFNADQEQTGLGAGVIRWFNADGIFSPYVGVAGGYSSTSRVNRPDESAPMTSGALGMLVHFGDSSFAWRSEARYRRILEDIALADVYLSSGLHWALGKGSDSGRRGRPDDSDADGVTDNFDLCPGTRGIVVDARGCPEADNDRDGVVNRLDRCPRTPNNIKVNSRGCPPDSDRDGVIDALDNCRNTAWEAEVDARGCPVNAAALSTADSDGDGVADSVDKCTGTPAGARVDTNGCPPPPPDARKMVLRGVVFESNSSQLRASSFATLNETADMLRANPGLNAEIAGHTDDQGDASYNQWLSERRAQSVVRYLTERGVAASRLIARGLGETMPVADNGTAEGRARNRRVELKIINP